MKQPGHGDEEEASREKLNLDYQQQQIMASGPLIISKQKLIIHYRIAIVEYVVTDMRRFFT